MEDKIYPNYKVFLESLDYDKEEIEKYFNILTGDLKNEVNSLMLSRDEEIKKMYDKYEESCNLHEKIKIDILKKYFDDYILINENFNKEIASLENESVDKINALLDTIEIGEEYERNIKGKILIEFYEKKKPYQEKIDEINKKIDKEYEKESNLVFDAKNKLIDNEKFYSICRKHIDEINKNISFFNELIEYNKELNSFDNTLSAKSDQSKLSIYIEYIENEKIKFLNINDQLDKFDLVFKTTSGVVSSLNDKKNEINSELINNKKEITASFNKIKESEMLISKKIALEKERENSNIKLIDKKEKVLLESLEKEKELISFEYYIKNNLLLKQSENINKFNNALNDTVSNLYIEYKNSILSNSKLISSTFDAILEILKDELNNINALKNCTIESRDIIDYFNKKFKSLELEKRLEILNLYRDFLISVESNNKELDILAFEILTSEQLIKLKELELKRRYLTLDYELKIKEIKYDMDIVEIERLKNVEISIKESKSSIELIKKDFLIDYNIKKNELKANINKLDNRKNLDILSSDYMCAYSRLENLSNIAKTKGSFDLQSIDLSTTLKLEKVIESSLIEAADKKQKFEGIIAKYNKDIEDVENEKDQRIRYMNNVLEIESNNFDKRKKDLNEITKNLESLIIPELVERKKHYGALLKKTNDKFLNDENKLKDSYNKIQNLINESDSLSVACFNNFSKSINSIVLKSLNDLTLSFISFIDDDYNNLILEINKILAKVSLNPLKDRKEFINKLNIKLLLLKENAKMTTIDIKTYIVNNSISFSSSIKKEFKDKLKSLIPYSSNKLSRKIQNLETDRKNILALLAINNVINSEENYKSIDEIKKSNDAVLANFEQQISDYKKTYLQTIDYIKTDYETKFNKLNGLRNKAILDNSNEQIIIDDKIKRSSEKLQLLRAKTKESIINESNSIESTTKNKISILSNKIQLMNDDYNLFLKNTESKNAEFRNNMIIKAKSYCEELEQIKNIEEKHIDNIKKEKIENRDKFIHDLKVNTLNEKNKIKLENLNIRDDLINKKADDIIKYGFLNNKYSNEQEEKIKYITDSINDFDSEVLSIVSSSVQKIQNVEEKLDSNIKQIEKDINLKLALINIIKEEDE